jgi:hypothetical protein
LTYWPLKTPFSANLARLPGRLLSFALMTLHILPHGYLNLSIERPGMVT